MPTKTMLQPNSSSTHSPSATIRRDKLKRDIQKGLLEARCTMHLTDDYAWDNATKFGQTEWLPARIIQKWERKPDHINFHEDDFSYQTGRAYWDGNDINFIVHANLYYKLRYIQPPPTNRPKKAKTSKP